MHLRSASVLLVTFAALGCSGGALSGQASKKGGSAAPSQAATGTGGDLQSDEEVDKASQPVQVSGAFLTLSCAEDDATPAAAGQTSEGCALNDKTGVKYAGSVTVTRVAVVYDDGTKDVPTFAAAPADGPWHVLFALAAAKVAEVSSYQIQATVDGQSVHVASRPHGTAAPAATATGTATAPACTPPVLTKTFTKLYAAHQDYANQKANGNGLDPVLLYGAADLKSGDQLRYASAAGNSIARITSDGSTKFVDKCPAHWVLTFLDKNDKSVGDSDSIDLASLATPTTVPDGTVSIVTGFHEGSKSDYPDNEGMPGLKDPKSGSTNGCTFVFEILRASCG